MLHHTDICGILKKAQDVSFMGQDQHHNFYDLIQAVRADRGMTDQERNQVLQQIRSVLGGSPESTPLSALMSGGLGGILGGVIAKYFELSPVVQLGAALGGFGLGTALYNRMTQTPSYHGYRF